MTQDLSKFCLPGGTSLSSILSVSVLNHLGKQGDGPYIGHPMSKVRYKKLEFSQKQYQEDFTFIIEEGFKSWVKRDRIFVIFDYTCFITRYMCSLLTFFIRMLLLSKSMFARQILFNSLCPSVLEIGRES